VQTVIRECDNSIVVPLTKEHQRLEESVAELRAKLDLTLASLDQG
jgi:hypothetical protein